MPEPFGVTSENLLRIHDFIKAGSADVLPYVQSLCAWLESKTSISEIASSPKVLCDYCGFEGIEIPEWWLTKRGHDIETIVRAPLNQLGFATGRGALLKEGKRNELIMFQAASYPELISKDFIAIFEGLRTQAHPTA